MRAWKEDQLHALIGEGSTEDLFEKITSFGREVGFESCAYGVRAPLPVSNPRIIMLNNYSQSWKQVYVDRDYLHFDPAVRHGMNSVSPFIWSGIGRDDKDAEFWEDANGHGIFSGWAQPVIAANGIRGMFTLTRGADSITDAEIKARMPKLMWLAQVAHYGLARRLVQEAGQAPALTPREAEVLRWIADGKTSCEIGMILDVSERTVNFHANCAMAKLEAPNRTAAVVRAVLLGLIT